APGQFCTRGAAGRSRRPRVQAPRRNTPPDGDLPRTPTPPSPLRVVPTPVAGSYALPDACRGLPPLHARRALCSSSPIMAAPSSSTQRGERGIALVTSLFVLTLLLLCTVSGLLIGAANVRALTGLRGTSQVHFVAESAIAEALQRVNADGLVRFQDDV